MLLQELESLEVENFEIVDIERSDQVVASCTVTGPPCVAPNPVPNPPVAELSARLGLDSASR